MCGLGILAPVWKHFCHHAGSRKTAPSAAPGPLPLTGQRLPDARQPDEVESRWRSATTVAIPHSPLKGALSSLPWSLYRGQGRIASR